MSSRGGKKYTNYTISYANLQESSWIHKCSGLIGEKEATGIGSVSRNRVGPCGSRRFESSRFHH